ncbi:MAG: YbdD/YjiX family protein [Burkholderiales bacterium]|nr:YbdD/YjiX family protein [Burkholderiales bacterium]
MKKLWKLIRRLSGDDAYERYLAHLKSFHPDREPLDRKAFFREEMDRKWTGVRRCC